MEQQFLRDAGGKKLVPVSLELYHTTFLRFPADSFFRRYKFPHRSAFAAPPEPWQG